MAGYKRLATILSIVVLGISSVHWAEAQEDEEQLISAVFDREEDGNVAVLLVENEKKEWIVDQTQLPDGSIPGEWFNIYFNQSHIHHIERLTTRTKTETIKVEQFIQKLFE